MAMHSILDKGIAGRSLEVCVRVGLVQKIGVPKFVGVRATIFFLLLLPHETYRTKKLPSSEWLHILLLQSLEFLVCSNNDVIRISSIKYIPPSDCMCAPLHVYCMHPFRVSYYNSVQSLIFQKVRSHEPEKMFSKSLRHLKDLELCHISFTDMTPIWPLLAVETRSFSEKIFWSTIIRNYIKSKFNISKIISNEPQNIFSKSLHHLKELELCHISFRHNPNLTSPSSQNRKFNWNKFSEALFLHD